MPARLATTVMIRQLAPRLGWLLRRAAVSTYEDGCLSCAKGAAYSAFLSFFPVLTTVTAVLVEANAEAVMRVIERFVFEIVPPGTEGLVLVNFVRRGSRPLALLISASIIAAWAASGVMMSLMEGFQAAYKLPHRRHFLKQRLVAILMVFAAAIPTVGASLLILFGHRTEQLLLQWMGLIPQASALHGGVRLAGEVIRILIALAATCTVTAMLYRFGPHRPGPGRVVWPGAVVATLLWLPATALFAWWVRNIADYNVMYGSIGAGLALLGWMYVLAVLALYGCEFNAEVERLVRSQAEGTRGSPQPT